MLSMGKRVPVRETGEEEADLTHVRKITDMTTSEEGEGCVDGSVRRSGEQSLVSEGGRLLNHGLRPQD
jgi:hypothetical protein